MAEKPVRMPHCYFLFPPHDGPVPNPFPIDDPLFRMSQYSIRALRESEEPGEQSPSSDTQIANPETAQSDAQTWNKNNHLALYENWCAKVYWISLQACSIAFHELINRILVSEPPTESHWDLAAFEAAHRAIAVVFYIHHEAMKMHPNFGSKKLMEALLTDWMAAAKDIWRARVLDPNRHDLIELPRKDHWNVPQLSTFILERLWLFPPDQKDPPADFEEALSHPANVGIHYSHEIKLWVEGAFRRLPDERDTVHARTIEDLGNIASAIAGPAMTEAPTKGISLGENIPSSESTYRFHIALSFPGEARARVQPIAEALAKSVPRERILYDRWLSSEFARPNLDTYLADLYRRDSLLLVFFMSGAYSRQEWCGLEWRVVRDLLKKKQDHRLMPLRLDESEVAGFHSIDGYLDIRDLSDDEVANAILQRLASVENAHFGSTPL